MTRVDHSKGVIVGSDQNQEWLLSWWWENYRKWNSYPVAFIDFGLSAKGKAWCQEKGIRIPLLMDDLFISDAEEISSPLTESWENKYGTQFWTSRKSWFKKPFACLKTPFQKTVWLDLDCEILRPLDSLFSYCDGGIALAKDMGAPTYNSGVIPFQKDHPLLHEWARRSLDQNCFYRGDQDLLSAIIEEKRCSVPELPSIYNWSGAHDLHPDTVICHWVGDLGKKILRYKVFSQSL